MPDERVLSWAEVTFIAIGTGVWVRDIYLTLDPIVMVKIGVMFLVPMWIGFRLRELFNEEI